MTRAHGRKFSDFNKRLKAASHLQKKIIQLEFLENEILSLGFVREIIFIFNAGTVVVASPTTGGTIAEFREVILCYRPIPTYLLFTIEKFLGKAICAKTSKRWATCAHGLRYFAE